MYHIVRRVAGSALKVARAPCGPPPMGPAFSFTFDGLVNHEGPSVVSGESCGAPTAGAHPAVDTYPITCSIGTAANYVVTGESPATLHVNP